MFVCVCVCLCVYVCASESDRTDIATLVSGALVPKRPVFVVFVSCVCCADQITCSMVIFDFPKIV